MCGLGLNRSTCFRYGSYLAELRHGDDTADIRGRYSRNRYDLKEAELKPQCRAVISEENPLPKSAAENADQNAADPVLGR